MDWGREFDVSYYEDRKYNRRYYEINAEMDRVLRALAPRPGETSLLIVTEDKHDLSRLPTYPATTRKIDDPAVIRVTNTRRIDAEGPVFGNFLVCFAWVPDCREVPQPHRGGVLMYRMRYDRFSDYDVGSEVYDRSVFEGLPIELARLTEVCELDPTQRYVKGKHYAPEGWEELKQIVAVIAKELDLPLDLTKTERGWTR